MGSAGLTDPGQAEEQQVALGHKAQGSLSSLSSQNLTLLLFQTLFMDRTWPRSEADPPLWDSFLCSALLSRRAWVAWTPCSVSKLTKIPH